MTPPIGRVLGGFRHRVDRRLTGKQPWRIRDGVWFYPPLEDVMTEARLQEVETYVSRCQNTVKQFIVNRPLMDLCMAAEQRPGSRVTKRWWDQDVMDVVGVWTADLVIKLAEGE